MATSTLGSGTLVLAGTTSGTTTVTATAVAGTTTLTLPAATDTLVGRATTDTLTNKTLTGAAMNGTLGATTPSTASVTTLTTSSTITHNGGTANGVAYLNGSKVLTTGSALGFDGTNLLLGTTSILTSGKLSLQADLSAVNAMTLRDSGTAYGVSSYYTLYQNSAGSTVGGIGHTAVTSLGINAITDLQFFTASTERARITSGGYSKFSNAGTYFNSTGSFHELRQTANAQGVVVSVTNASYTSESIFSTATKTAGTDWLHFYGTSDSNTVANIKIFGNGNLQNANNSYGAISDVKLKENIVDASPKLADLMQVKVRNYNLIGDTTKQLGVVAQELETVFPAMVDETFDRDTENNILETKTKSVKYSVFVPMLIKAIQEQQALISQLTARITALEGA